MFPHAYLCISSTYTSFSGLAITDLLSITVNIHFPRMFCKWIPVSLENGFFTCSNALSELLFVSEFFRVLLLSSLQYLCIGFFFSALEGHLEQV